MTTTQDVLKQNESQTVWQRLEHPHALYKLIYGCTVVLLISGLVMVASASSIFAYNTYNGNQWALFERQFVFAIIGFFFMVILIRCDTKFLKRISALYLAGVVVLLVAVLLIGTSVNGQKNWIEFGSFIRFQPSEFAKLGIVLYGATIFAKRENELHIKKRLLSPYGIACLTVIFLVGMEKDVGTAMILMPIMASALYFVGAPKRWFAYIGAACLGLILLATVVAPYRVARFTSWLNPYADQQGTGYQLIHGQRALGSGGLLGAGLGGSKEKWGTLPEAHTDFIYAVIGEEAGLFGTVTILGLFAAIILAALRIARLSDDLFTRLVTLGIVTWIATQAFVNIGAVLGIMPITGVPLPLVSYGGSSLIPTLAALGILLSFARTQARASEQPV
ncbi:MAG: putative lipid II flippase FtsW [Actinobacteria bacterium]|nr:putative lipid II flippase FtsW [Actinomycetota bacterium]NBY15619.1 putative lipid II flippase FtsW [Actinomycetota bacterium]